MGAGCCYLGRVVEEFVSSTWCLCLDEPVVGSSCAEKYWQRIASFRFVVIDFIAADYSSRLSSDECC